MNNIIFLMEYKMLSGIKGDINTYFYIHYSGMYTSSQTLSANRGSKCAPSCVHFPGVTTQSIPPDQTIPGYKTG